MRSRIGGLVALLALAVALAVPGAERQPDLRLADSDYAPTPTTSVSAGYAAEVVVDEEHGQVFVAQREAGLLVLDLDGKPITTIAMPGAQGSLSLSSNGRSLYVVAGDTFGEEAFRETDVLRVSTTSLQVEQVAESALADDCQFRAIEQLGGRLWFSVDCRSSTGTSEFGFIDLADGSVVEVSTPERDIQDILSFPGRKDRLVLLTLSQVQLVRIRKQDRVLGPDLITVALRAMRRFNFDGVAGVSPDGAEIVVSDGTGARRLSADNLDTLGAFRGDDQASAIAVRADGTVAIGSVSGAGLSIYRPGQYSPIRTYGINPTSSGGVARRGLAWGTGRVYAVRGNGGFYAFVPRLRPHLQVEVGDRDFRYGEQILITVTLDGPSTGRDVTIWSVDGRDVRRQIGTLSIPVGGSATLTAVARQHSHFEAAFAGNEQYDPTRDRTSDISVSARIKSAISSGRLVKGVRVHRVREPVVLEGTVLPDHAGDCLYAFVEVFSGGLWRDRGYTCPTLDEGSSAVARFRASREDVGRKFRIHWYFFGDEDSTATSGRWHYFRFVT